MDPSAAEQQQPSSPPNDTSEQGVSPRQEQEYNDSQEQEQEQEEQTSPQQHSQATDMNENGEAASFSNPTSPQQQQQQQDMATTSSSNSPQQHDENDVVQTQTQASPPQSGGLVTASTSTTTTTTTTANPPTESNNNNNNYSQQTNGAAQFSQDAQAYANFEQDGTPANTTATSDEADRAFTEQQRLENEEKMRLQQPQSRILNIEVYYGEGVGTNYLSIEVVEPSFKKPFLGGYRHRKTGIEYHHASSQTEYISAKKRRQLLSGAPLDEQEEDNVQKFHRETQTVKTKDTSQQTMREQGTQMAKPGVVIDNSNDRIYIPAEKHFSSEDFHNLRVEHAIKIQAFVRGWRARKRASQLAEEKHERETKSQRDRAEQQRLEGERKRKELQRRMHPKTKRDFEVLYNELEQWRTQETERIKEHETDPEARRLAMAELLRKETKLLQTIDRLKQSAAKENSHEKVNRKLEYLSKPKQLQNWDGETTHVETPFTVRARELMDLYHGLETPMLSVDERLDVLLHVKWTVKEFDCILTRDIVELIDREADLLNRGRKNQSLEGLRKRLSNLFLQFIETPAFNPLSSKLARGGNTKFANTEPLNA